MREGGFVARHGFVRATRFPLRAHYETDRLEEGQMVAIDGNAGVVFVEQMASV